MIAKLRGTIDSIGDGYCVVDVNGVGYLVFASARTIAKITRGTLVSFYIETIVREDSISLYGFADALERAWFLTLTKVQGVGAKVCLNILSVLSPTEMNAAVATGDKASFTRAVGVGPKLGARLVTELKGKVVTVPIEDASLDPAIAEKYSKKTTTEDAAVTDISSSNFDNSQIEDSISALVNLGYARVDAYQVVYNIIKEKPDSQTSDLIKLSLKEFAKRDF